MVYDMTNCIFSGKPPPGEPFTIKDHTHLGTTIITGVYTEDGVFYITDQQWKWRLPWKPHKQYGESIIAISRGLIAAIEREGSDE